MVLGIEAMKVLNSYKLRINYPEGGFVYGKRIKKTGKLG